MSILPVLVLPYQQGLCHTGECCYVYELYGLFLRAGLSCLRQLGKDVEKIDYFHRLNVLILNAEVSGLPRKVATGKPRRVFGSSA